MGASGAKYGIATSHFYWIGAIPAMVFVGVFMMPFYYGSKARSVPEYLRLRFDEKTRALNAFSFAVMTVFSSGISMYAMAKLIQTLHVFDASAPGHGLAVAPTFHASIVLSALIVLGYIFLGGLDQRHLQRGAAVLPDRRRLPAAGVAGSEECWRLGGLKAQLARGLCPFLARHGTCADTNPHGRGMVRAGDGLWRSCSRSATGARIFS